MPEHYDVIIIGTGAGGGTLAHTLAPSGKRVLLLERGDFLPREMDNWSPEAVFVDGQVHLAPTPGTTPPAPVPAPGPLLRGRGHQALRGRPLPPSARRLRRDPPPGRPSPAWPLSYDDFEPWYSQAEQLYQVHGTRDEDPTEGHWSQPYPWPAVSHEARLQEISDALKGHGYHPFSAPVGIMLDEADRGRSACIRCAWCDGYPCLVHAKADAEVIGVRPLLDLPNVTLLTNAEVLKLETGRTGHAVTGVAIERHGHHETYSADIVALCAGAANSAKVLLQSATEHHPDGLANGSDQVGRNYMFHNCKAVAALGKEMNSTVFQKTLGINDFYLASKDRDWPLGNIQMIGKSNAGAMKGEEPKLTRIAPRRSLDDVAEHSVDWWLTTEDLPMADNRVTVDKRGHVHLAYQSTNDKEAEGPVRGAEDGPQPCRLGPAPRVRQELLHDHEHPHRRRRPPGRHVPALAPTRPPRSSTSTARPTRWTTSTWSTPASSPASAPSTRPLPPSPTPCGWAST